MHSLSQVIFCLVILTNTAWMAAVTTLGVPYERLVGLAEQDRIQEARVVAQVLLSAYPENEELRGIVVSLGNPDSHDVKWDTFWIVPDLGIRLIRVEPGSVRGREWSRETLADDFVDEGIRTVTVREPYYLGETEVTQGQWKAVMGRTQEQQRDWSDPTLPLNGVGDSVPIYYVSWWDALEFCIQLSIREQQAGRLPYGWIYTLPAEDEWEYASRAGSEMDDHGEVNNRAWYKENSDARAHSVKEKLPNPWGFYDLQGNVWEWCRNRYKEGRARRGGGWNCLKCWAYGHRNRDDELVSSSGLGFRLALIHNGQQ